MSPFRILAFILLLVFFAIFVQMGVLAIAFEKLGLSNQSAYLLFGVTLLGSLINLPLFKMKTNALPPDIELPPFFRAFLRQQSSFQGVTQISMNVGGALVPICFSYYLWTHSHLSVVSVAMAVSVVAISSFLMSRPVAGLGVTMPMLFAPLLAALTATLLSQQERAPLAYIAGTLGVLIGADLFHMKDIKNMGVPFASIGGAGSFDGVFITGIVAVLLT
ncbi:MAG TPA: DUF1614 domain-containing protein [Pseudomonadales bacterium]|nr:DUF1614 domain-containing protein [Pseudomonadales bacterium]